MTAWFLHGFTGSGADWSPLLAALPDVGAVWAPTLLPAAGEAAPLPVERLDPAAAVLAERADGVDVVGYSMGGRLALTLAVTAPDRVRSLTLIGAGPGLADEAQRAARRAWDQGMARRAERDVGAFADHWETLPLLASQARIEAGARAGLRRRRRERSGRGLAACLRGWGTGSMRPLHAELGRLEIPVLIVTGAEDAKYRAIGDAMAACIPGAARFDVAGAGHTAHLERPSIVGRRLGAFLATVQA